MTTGATAPLRCQAHGALAGWECTVCHQPLCPDCAALKVIPPAAMTACGLCGELAEPLLRLRTEGRSLAQRLPGAFLFPFRGEGLPAWLGMGMLLALFSYTGALGQAIAWGLTLGALFGLARSTARGGEALELNDFRDMFASAFGPLVMFAVAMLPAWAGALLAWKLDAPRWAWGLVALVTVLWSPTAFIGAATGASVVHLLNPLRVLGVAARLGKDLGVYLGGLLAVSVVMLVALPVSVLLDGIWVPVLSRWLSSLALLYGPVVGARVAGEVLFLHGHLFGWGVELDRYEHVLGAVEPRGQLPQKTSTLPAHLPKAIELEPEVVPVAPAGNRFAALELPAPDDEAAPRPEVAPLDAALLPSHGGQAAREIRAAMRRNDTDAALDGWRATGLAAAEALDFDELVWLGQAAASRIDTDSAELAFRSAAERKAPPEALGRARVMLARLLAERLKRDDDARRWMERTVAEQPGTQAATFAAEWLTKQRAG